MEHAEAEAIYDSGREACAEFVLELARRFEELAERSERELTRLQTRIERLEEELRKNSRNSSNPELPSSMWSLSVVATAAAAATALNAPTTRRVRPMTLRLRAIASFFPSIALLTSLRDRAIHRTSPRSRSRTLGFALG
jgi:hypothetical protein